MKDRIKELRKQLGLTLEKFGKNFGVGKTAISKIESGERNITEQMVLSILKTNWNGRYVNEDWLRYGTGDMFAELPPEDKFASAVARLSGFPNVREVLTILGNDASDDFLNEFEELIQTLKKGSD